MNYKRKRRLKKKPIIILITIILAIVGISIFTVNTINKHKYHQTMEYKLLQVGYSLDEIDKLKNKTNDEFLEYLLTVEYDKMYLDIIKEKYYIKDLIKDYVNYYNDNLNDKSDKIVTLVNTGADKEWYSNIKTTDISKDILMINNKTYKLPDDYEPDDLVDVKNWYAYGNNPKLRKEAYEKFIEMFNKAKEEKLTIIINSSYRSYKYQEDLYNSYLTQNGKSATDAYAARPGHSEHQTGLTIDVTTYGANGDTFDKTDEFKWLQDNAYKYGFILRYPKGKEYITGYKYESWHYRYVGVDAATTIHDNDITFDEYYAYYIEYE